MEGNVVHAVKKRKLLDKKIQEPIIMMAPQISEYDDEFTNYINPDYDKYLYEKA